MTPGSPYWPAKRSTHLKNQLSTDSILLFCNKSRNSEKPFQWQCAHVDFAKFSVLASCPYIMQHIYIITKQIETYLQVIIRRGEKKTLSTLVTKYMVSLSSCSRRFTYISVKTADFTLLLAVRVSTQKKAFARGI
jgi:hypothetical protein